jgi:hypothetical protein
VVKRGDASSKLCSLPLARASFFVLSARGFVALLLTRSHAMFQGKAGVGGGGLGEEPAWLQGLDASSKLCSLPLARSSLRFKWLAGASLRSLPARQLVILG